MQTKENKNGFQLSLYDRISFVDLSGFEDQRICLGEEDRANMKTLADFLGDEQYSVKSPQIEMFLGVSGVKVRAYVHCLRLAGVPLASSSRGYWIAKTKEELRTTIEHLGSRRNALQTMISSLEKANFS